MILELLEKVCNALESEQISYMLSGSLAMNIYTVPRMTRDIDIVIHLRPSDIEKFVRIFEKGFYINRTGIGEEIKRQGMFNVIDHESGLKLDFIIRKDTEFHLHEFERRQKNAAMGFDCWVVSIEDLVIAKLKWIQQLQSDTQLRDIGNLMKNPVVDSGYVSLWVKKLNLKTFGLI